jgi:hypothetical protein
MRPTEAPKQRWLGVALLSLVVFVELAWAVALVYLVLHFL